MRGKFDLKDGFVKSDGSIKLTPQFYLLKKKIEKYADPFNFVEKMLKILNELCNVIKIPTTIENFHENLRRLLVMARKLCKLCKIMHKT